MRSFPFIRVGLIISIAPLILAFITSIFQGGSMWNEGSGTGGYIWFMILTIPIGLLLISIGLLNVLILKIRG